ncbi:MAG: glycoside hydrolase family 57 protein [Cytophagaceae bacterium]|nr:glycoside hydrolase family 57 protein [Cytophagaceae bacterium]
MRSISLCFQVHQPYRMLPYTFFDLGNNHVYEDNRANETILKKVAENCYLPANALLLELTQHFMGDFRCTFSLTGTFLEQSVEFNTPVLSSFQNVVRSNCIEILSETYYHSLSAFFHPEEFRRQIDLHRKYIHKYFGLTPSIFRNTELIHNNAIAEQVKGLGLKGILTEGVATLLKGRNNQKLYTPSQTEIPLLLRHCTYSDDIAFRFSDKQWKGYPLSATTFAEWIDHSLKKNEHLTLYIDYETLGEHHSSATGIFEFIKELPKEILSRKIHFLNPSEAIESHDIQDVYDAHHTISWADSEKDLSAWYMNSMQREALEKIYSLTPLIYKIKNRAFLETWSRLQTSDHFYYMSTKGLADGKVHQYFSPFPTPYDAYIHYMNIVADFELELKKYSIL